MVEPALSCPLAALAEAELERLAQVTGCLLAGRVRLTPGQQPARQRAGRGREFLDYRHYLPGDELRTVDWRVSLRCRQLQVRRYRDETAGDWFICLDRSASMGLFDKWSLAVQLAAAWAYLLLHLDHRVGLVTFSSRVDGLCPLGRGHDQYGQVLRFLRATFPRAEGGGSVLGSCADAIGQRVAIMVISDFLTEDGMQSGLAKLPGTEMHALQVLAEAELQLSATAQVTLQDVETRRHLLLYLSPREQALARAALTRLQEHLAGYCRQRSIVFTPGSTSQSWREVLLNHLRKLQPAHA
jgi:uncharacterized protein (DUF58 family)